MSGWRKKPCASAPVRTRPLLFAVAACLLWGAAPARAGTADAGAIELQIVGGLGGVTQYTRLEQPFWEREMPERSHGRVVATIRPMDAGGVRVKEMLQLMRLGVVPFGTVLLSVTSGDEPELAAIDLAVLNPDISTLRRSVEAFRSHMRDLLHERYGIELLGIYAYPAQVLFCRRAFSGLEDIAGRKVRTSSVGQSELMSALGAIPVLLPFAKTAQALREGVAECAITGTMSGYEIKLPATHVHDVAVGWGLSVFGANAAVWNDLPPDVQKTVREGVADLEHRIWARAETDTVQGLDCNTGRPSCAKPPSRPMIRVASSPADAAQRRRLLSEVVLPRWIERCGVDCSRAWNTYLAPVHGLSVEQK